MSVSKVIKIGDTRSVRVKIGPGRFSLKPSEFALGNPDGDGDEFYVLTTRCSVIRVQEFRYRWPTLREDAGWFFSHFEIDSLQSDPSWWDRLKAFVLRRPPPLPRAITLVGGDVR